MPSNYSGVNQQGSDFGAFPTHTAEYLKQGYDGEWEGRDYGYTFPVPEELFNFPGIGGGTNGYDPEAFAGDPDGRRVTGVPAGGVPPTSDDADYIATDFPSLKDALANVPDGGVVYVDRDIDAGDPDPLTIPTGVTLVGDRTFTGDDNRETGIPTIKLDGGATQVYPLFNAKAGARITGVGLDAPVKTLTQHSWEHEHTGIAVHGDDVEIDNSVFRGWGNAAADVGEDGTTVSRCHIHHNHIVDSPLKTLGYGVMVTHGTALIQRNYFDHNRHAVACDGASDSRYEAAHNYCGPRSLLQVWDMHRGEEAGAGSGEQAGDWFDIHHNLVEARYEFEDSSSLGATYIRGDPLSSSDIEGNVFCHSGRPETPEGVSGGPYLLEVTEIENSNITVSNNRFGYETEYGAGPWNPLKD